MQSDAIDVDSYLTQVPEGRRAVLTEIRDACRRLLTGFAESMSYGMPTYSREGTAEIAWASQKRYISLYVMRADVLDAHRGRLSASMSVRDASGTAALPWSTSPLSIRCSPLSRRAAARSAELSRHP